MIKNSEDKDFKIEWRCFSCGSRWRSRKSLGGHLKNCYWHSFFKSHIEDAPFYREVPSRQLRYYHRNRKMIRDKYKEKKELANTPARSKVRLPRTLK